MTRRALLLTTDFAPMNGGIARLLTQYVDASSGDLEWRVVVRADGDDTPSVRHAASPFGLAREVRRQAAWLRDAPDRLVVCGHAYLTPAALFAGAASRAPVGALAYGKELVPRRLAHRVPLSLLRATTRVAAISTRTAAAVEALGVLASKVTVVAPVLLPPWQRIERLAPRPAGAPLRLVAVSRLAEGYKNIELLLRLVALLHPSVVESLTIVGNGDRLAPLRRKATEIGVNGAVQFTGHLPDAELGELLARCHLAVFPSRESTAEGGFEGFGLVVQELAASGLPVLVGAVGGAVDAADPAWSFLLDPDDLRAWVGTVTRLYHDEPLRSAMARSALDWGRSVDVVEAARRLTRALFS